jgi:outer membrane protein TolC
VRQKLRLLALLLLARVASGEERLLSLPEALRLAAQGPALQAAAAARQAAAYRVDEVKSLRWPQLELQAQARSLTKDPGFLVPRGSFGNPVTLALVTGE